MLLKSTLSSLPTHYLSIFTIPIHMENRLEKLQRNFFWGKANEEFLASFSGLGYSVFPYQNGGLAVKKLSTFNHAFLRKLLWHYDEGITRHIVGVTYGDVFFLKVKYEDT